MTITKTKLHECFFYSEGELVWRERPRHHFKTLRSCRSVNSRLAGVSAGTKSTSKNSSTSYVAVEVDGIACKAHRIVWVMHNGPIPKGVMVDHINGVGFDNRIENLRLVDSLSSAHNLPRQKSNTSGVVGVCWHKSAKKWQARISFRGERFDLGRFDSFDDAVYARKKAEYSLGYHENHGRG